MRRYRNIIFDLGGVILHIDYARTIAAFKKLGIENFDKIYSQKQQTGLFDELEKGLIGADVFREALLHHLPAGTTHAQVDAAWNAMLLDFPAENLAFLSRLRSECRLFLLSNTNEIHLKEVMRILQRSHGFGDLALFFERAYYSHRLGMRKPDAEIFRHVLGHNKLHPSETLFIDDSPQHVKGAQALGIEARLTEKNKLLNDPEGPLKEFLS